MHNYEKAIESDIKFYKEMIKNCENHIADLRKCRPLPLILPEKYVDEKLHELLQCRKEQEEQLNEAMRELRELKKEMYNL